MWARAALRGVRVMYGEKLWGTVQIDRDYGTNRHSQKIWVSTEPPSLDTAHLDRLPMFIDCSNPTTGAARNALRAQRAASLVKALRETRNQVLSCTASQLRTSTATMWWDRTQPQELASLHVTIAAPHHAFAALASSLAITLHRNLHLSSFYAGFPGTSQYVDIL